MEDQCSEDVIVDRSGKWGSKRGKPTQIGVHDYKGDPSFLGHKGIG